MLPAILQLISAFSPYQSTSVCYVVGMVVVTTFYGILLSNLSHLKVLGTLESCTLSWISRDMKLVSDGGNKNVIG